MEKSKKKVNKDVFIVVRATKDEKEKIKNTAKKLGVSVSKLVMIIAGQI